MANYCRAVIKSLRGTIIMQVHDENSIFILADEIILLALNSLDERL
jgi:hypothetical protein